jgi:hypothetical protein
MFMHLKYLLEDKLCKIIKNLIINFCQEKCHNTVCITSLKLALIQLFCNKEYAIFTKICNKEYAIFAFIRSLNCRCILENGCFSSQIGAPKQKHREQ